MRVARYTVLVCILGVGCVDVVTHRSAVTFVRNEEIYKGIRATEWKQLILSSDRSEKRKAIRALVDGGEDSVPVVIELLRRADEHSGSAIESILSRIGKPALEPVVDLLSHPAVYTRYHAVSVLRNFAEDSVAAVGAIGIALADENPAVAMESARALAAIGKGAAPAAKQLARTLSHDSRVVRATAAGALASIGPGAKVATPELITALRDEDPSVRRCAADALAAIGPGASSAVSALVSTLKDENIYVRVCAAGALGSMGDKASQSLEALRSVLDDPATRAEAAWAIEQISGVAPTLPKSSGDAKVVVQPHVASDDWTMFCGNPSRNTVVEDADVPMEWSTETRENILWSARLGNETYGTPIIVDDVVYVGTGNETPRDVDMIGSMGMLMAFNAKDGTFLWQDPSPPLGRGLDTFLLAQTTSSPLVEGERMYYITAQALLRCLDTKGFTDGENDGKLQDEWRKTKYDADHLWELDISAALGVFPHEAPNCSVISVGDLLMVCTSNGVDEAHTNVPAPRAPSFIAVDKRDGSVAWQFSDPSSRVLHGQWSSPSIAQVHGMPVAFFGGGDGWLYAIEAKSGREIWRYDGNPKNAVWRPSGDIDGVEFRNNIIACPVVDQGRIYLAMGQDPNHGQGKGRIHAIDPGGRGDVTGKRTIWETDLVGRCIATPVVHEGLLYAADYNGYVHCIDAENGKTVWTHDLFSGVWSGLIVIGDRLYVGDEDGTVSVFSTGREKKLLAQNDLDAPIWGGFSVSKNVLYVTTSREIFAIGLPKYAAVTETSHKAVDSPR